MKTALRTVDDLAKAGLISPETAPDLRAVVERYALAITPEMAALIDNPNGPIARQFVPDARELESAPHELADPIGDEAHSPLEGLVHRYPDRVLLKLIHLCPAYCRFCFRREMVGKKKAGLSPQAFEVALAYIQADPQIWEVIFTGGDPFLLSARRIKEIVRRLDPIKHVKVLRWHTRVPMVAPGRITEKFVRALKAGSKTVYVAIHANHGKEFHEEARSAIQRLADAGIPLLGQSVLLKGINDEPAALEELMRVFVELRIKPYYLHHPDLAPGTKHFRSSLEWGQELVGELRRRASGLCQPGYTLDLPGGAGKIPVGPNYIVQKEKGGLILRDLWGEAHFYAD